MFPNLSCRIDSHDFNTNIPLNIYILKHNYNSLFIEFSHENKYLHFNLYKADLIWYCTGIISTLESTHFSFKIENNNLEINISNDCYSYNYKINFIESNKNSTKIIIIYSNND